MSNLPAGRRADARRNVAATITAATRVLGERPQASVDEIAAAAGVTRQTVYAHFPSRAALVRAVVEQLTAEALAAFDAAALDEGPATDALLRFVSTAWRLFDRHPFLLAGAEEAMSAADAEALHAPVLTRLERLLRRGRRTGEFDRAVPLGWLVTAIVALGHAAGSEVAAGRLSSRRAERAVGDSVLRLVGAIRVRPDAVARGS